MNKVIVAVLLLWSGLLLGVSFVATPAKFLAPSLPMAQALDVGRSTFHVLAQIEWAIAVLVAALLASAWRSGTALIGLVTGCLAVVIAVLAVESFVLRPLLDARVLRIIAGESVPPSQMHNFYIALEALRLVLILSAGIVSLRRTDSSMNNLSELPR